MEIHQRIPHRTGKVLGPIKRGCSLRRNTGMVHTTSILVGMYYICGDEEVQSWAKVSGTTRFFQGSIRLKR